MQRGNDSLPYGIRRSSIHQRGLFAQRLIPKGTRIIEYTGERITKAESRRRSEQSITRAKRTGGGAVYVFELNQRTDIDGNVPYNTARYVNHSCLPNCQAEIIRGRIWFVALRNIQLNEELSYDYGYDIEHFEEHPCRCGCWNCLGYIVRKDQRRRLKRILAKRAGRT